MTAGLLLTVRELRRKSRQPFTYWTRCAVGGMGVLLAAGAARGAGATALPAFIGARIFDGIAYTLLCLAVGTTFIVADTISRERREGTLGLLFLTELKPIEVVFSKIASAVISASYELTAAVPALAIALLIGGVSSGRLIRTFLALFSILLVALASGAFASSRSSRQMDAILTAAVIVFLLCLLPLMFSNPFLRMISPWSAFRNSGDAVYGGWKARFWFSLLACFVEALFFFWLAARSLAANWRQEGVHVWRLPLRFAKSASNLQQKFKWILEKDPVCWVSLRARGENAWVWLGALLVVLGGFSSFLIGFTYGVRAVLSLGADAAFAWAAGRYFFEARQSGELELLLSTPLGGRDIVLGRWRGLLLRCRGPLLFAGFCLFLQFIAQSTMMARTNSVGAIAAGMLWPFVKVLDVVAIAWLAMWFGMRANRPGTVVLGPLLFVGILPMGVTLAAWFLVPFGLSFMILPWIELLKDIVCIRWAVAKLEMEFRTAAPLKPAGWLDADEALLETAQLPAEAR